MYRHQSFADVSDAVYRKTIPENWQDLPARHDQSILNLPDLTKDDIAAMYDAWTEARAEGIKRRYDEAYLAEHEATILEEVRTSAACG